jgi:hypothetical protein
MGTFDKDWRKYAMEKATANDLQTLFDTKRGMNYLGMAPSQGFFILPAKTISI